jgi:hypothetical protein
MFSDDYWTARQRFRSLAAAQGGKLDSLFPVQNSDLSIDCAWFGDTHPKNLLIHIAGVHGVEGFVGSAIQCELLSGKFAIPAETACLFVHPLNPFGMANLRRANQNNVDLNRNALGVGEAYNGQPDRYEVVRNLCAIEKMSSNRVLFFAKALVAVFRYGFAPLRQAVAGGQYNHPQDIYFGGYELQPELSLLYGYLSGRIDTLDRLTVIDVHSGLGEYSSDILIGSIAGALQDKEQVSAALGQRLISAATGGDVYSVRGEILDSLGRLIRANEQLLFIQEFGTYSGLRVFEALTRENWHWFSTGEKASANRGEENRVAAHSASSKQLHEVFVPTDQKWRTSVLSQGVDVFNAALGRFS